jgi:hypothetical protein
MVGRQPIRKEISPTWQVLLSFANFDVATLAQFGILQQIFVTTLTRHATPAANPPMGSSSAASDRDDGCAV